MRDRMKLLAFGDIHCSITALNKIELLAKKHEPDILLCCGDISIFEQYLDLLLKKLASIKKPVYIIHGNHETEEAMKILSARHENLIFMHKKIAAIQDCTIIGYGGGGFSQTEPEFEKFIKKNEEKIKNKKIILLTHAPPHNTKIDFVHNEHVGCKTFKKFITQNKPIMAISGHIHETCGKQDFIGKTLVINPGPFGRVIDIQ